MGFGLPQEETADEHYFLNCGVFNKYRKIPTDHRAFLESVSAKRTTKESDVKPSPIYSFAISGLRNARSIL